MDKPSGRSRVVSTHKLMPEDINFYGTLFGGKLFSWFDMCAGIAAERHCEEKVLTVAVDEFKFIDVAGIGAVVEVEAYPSFVGKSSIEITVMAHVVNELDNRMIASAFFTFATMERRSIAHKLISVCGGDDEMIREGERRYLQRKAQRTN